MKQVLLSTFLLAIAVIGLILGCGGDKGTETPAGDDKKGGSGTQGGREKAADLATFLPGKRISFSVHEPDAPAEVQESTMLAQFELDGTITMGAVFEGKTVAVTDKKLTFKVDGLKVTLPNPFEEGEATLTFSSANPKVGDKFTIGEPGEPKGEEAIISAIEKGGKLELKAQIGFGQPEPGEPDPEIIGGSEGSQTAFGMGPNGEFAKSKHPTFMAHSWKMDPFSRGPKHTAVFGKDGTLAITPDKGKPAKGTWEVAEAVLTLTYPNADTGKEQSLKYRFQFGRSELGYSDGSSRKFETLSLEPAGGGHPAIGYERPFK